MIKKLSRFDFYVLHEALSAKCFAEKAPENDTEFYGYGTGVQHSESLRQQVETKTKEKLNGKMLWSLKRSYNQGAERLPMNEKDFFKLLRFLEMDEPTFYKRVNDYKKKRETASPPEDIRPKKNQKVMRNQRQRMIWQNENLDNMSRHQWWFYFLEYEHAMDTSNKIIRLVLNFQKQGNDYSVVIENTGDDYATWRGRIVTATDRLLICELEGEDKRKYFMASIEKSGEKSLYTGIFLKHNADSKLFACSVLLHRIEIEDVPHPHAAVFSWELPEERVKVPEPIWMFFEKKSYVHLKNAKKYSVDDLSNWLLNKRGIRGEHKKKPYSLFVAAPVGGVKERELKHVPAWREAVVEKTLETMRRHGIASPAAFQQDLTGQLQELLEFKICGMNPSKTTSRFEHLHGQVLEIIQQLKKNWNVTIYCSWEHTSINDHPFDLPRQAIDKEYTQLQHSEAFLLVCNGCPETFSSCWILLALAISMGLPTFVLFEYKDDLPFILQEGWQSKRVRLLQLGSLQLSSRQTSSPKNLPYELLTSDHAWRDLFKERDQMA